MKYCVILSQVCFVAFLLGCSEYREEGQHPRSEDEYYKTIGEAIPFETGMEWMRNYKDRTADAARTEVTSGYLVDADTLGVLLESTADLVGIAFHYGLDDQGEKHIILIAVDASMSLWTEVPGRVFVDANTGTQISRRLAESWAANFKNANPSGLWFHFFGRNIFDDMSALPYFEAVDIEPALSTIDLTPQMLLIVWDNTQSVLGRTNDDPGTVYDASNACPPCAVH